MKIEVITHYAEDDADFGYDPYSYEIKIDGKTVKHYGDDYHDKGRHKIDAFLDAVEIFFPDFDLHDVIHIKVADGLT